MINGHGNDWYNTDCKIVGDFSSNVPYINNADIIINHIKNKLHSVKNYPDPNSRVLTEKIATLHNVAPDNVLVTNGSSEAFYLIAQLFAKSSSLIAIPSFAEYTDAAKAFDHQLIFSRLDSLDYNSKIEQNLVWLANPNNPDGRIIPSENISFLASNNKNIRIIVDFAYSFLHKEIKTNFINQGIDNVISVHSMTKSFAIPGIRLGYIIADKNIIKEINSFRVPWAVSSVAINAGEFILDNYDNLLPDVKRLIKECKDMQLQMNKIQYLDVVYSDCNFFITKMLKGSSSDLKEFLLKKHGLLIRDASNFNGLDNTFFRLSVQSKDDNERLINAIKDYFDSI